MATTKILLEDYRTEGSKVFTGRDRGIEVRNQSQINELESKFDSIDIIVPDDVRSINPSFLEEFLSSVVLKLKEAKFKEKFKFVTTGRYNIQPDLDEAVESILREENALTQ